MGRAAKQKKSTKTCADCIHEYACQMWNIGYMHNTDAENCTEYTRVKDSASYLIGKMDGRKEAEAQYDITLNNTMDESGEADGKSS